MSFLIDFVLPTYLLILSAAIDSAILSAAIDSAILSAAIDSDIHSAAIDSAILSAAIYLIFLFSTLDKARFLFLVVVSADAGIDVCVFLVELWRRLIIELDFNLPFIQFYLICPAR